MTRSLSLIAALALGLSAAAMPQAMAQNTCHANPLPQFMAGSPPKDQRSPIAIRADPGDAAHCQMQANTCQAPTPTATVVETAPSCTCVCR